MTIYRPLPFANRVTRYALVLTGLALAASGLAGPLSPARAAGQAAVQAPAQHQVLVEPASRTMRIRLYYVAVSDNGRSGTRIGCGDSLVAVTRIIPYTSTPLTAAMRLLLQNHNRFYGQSGLYNPLYQATLQLKRASVVSGKAWIYLTGKMNLRGVCDNPRVDGMLKSTVRQFTTVHAVAIYINNIPLQQLLSGR